MWEISENLHRAELTVTERAEHIAEWVKLTREKVAQVAPPGGRQPRDQGIRSAVRELGIDRTEAQRSEHNVRWGELLSRLAALKAAKDADLAREVEVLLQVAAKLPQKGVGQGIGGGRPEGGANVAARAVNISEYAMRRSQKIAALSPEVKKAAVDAGLDRE